MSIQLDGKIKTNDEKILKIEIKKKKELNKKIHISELRRNNLINYELLH